MSREIKFRGFYKFDGNALYPKVSRWIYGYLTIKNEVTWINDIEDQTMSYCVSSKSVGQFTGLLDKNGKEIYEGDIIRNYLDDIQKVRYDGGRWHCDIIKKATIHWPAQFLDCTYMGWEVIGNIYENPEMVK